MEHARTSSMDTVVCICIRFKPQSEFKGLPQNGTDAILAKEAAEAAENAVKGRIVFRRVQSQCPLQPGMQVITKLKEKLVIPDFSAHRLEWFGGRVHWMIPIEAVDVESEEKLDEYESILLKEGWKRLEPDKKAKKPISLSKEQRKQNSAVYFSF